MIKFRVQLCGEFRQLIQWLCLILITSIPSQDTSKALNDVEIPHRRQQTFPITFPTTSSPIKDPTIGIFGFRSTHQRKKIQQDVTHRFFSSMLSYTFWLVRASEGPSNYVPLPIVLSTIDKHCQTLLKHVFVSFPYFFSSKSLTIQFFLRFSMKLDKNPNSPKA